MKSPILIFLTGLIFGVGLMFVLCIFEIMPIDCGCSGDDDNPAGNLPPTQGAVIDTAVFQTLVTTFDTTPPSIANTGNTVGNWGGKIGVAALAQLISGITEPETKFLDYRFGLQQNENENKIFLIFYRKDQQNGEQGPLIIRSPDDPRSFCPTICTLDN